MAGSLNKVQLIGNVGKAPETRSFDDGGKVANFSLATTETWRDKSSGEKKDRTDWHNISIRNPGLVGVVEKYVSKGTKLYLEGELQTRKYTDRDGNEKYITEVVLRPYGSKLVLLGGRGQDDDSHQENRSAPASGSDRPPTTYDQPLDDEIPF